MPLIRELKKRGVIRIGLAYAVVAWLLIQVADILLEAFDAPSWLLQAFIILMAIGFPVALALSWFFELTHEGVVREQELAPGRENHVSLNRSLNTVIISILLAAVFLFALDKFWWRSGTQGLESRQGTSVAVLPFANRSSLADDAYFADGMHDDILTALAGIGALNVISRTSVMKYRDSDKTIPEIGRELGANAILEGGVQRAGNQVRINAQLIDADSDTHLWADNYDRQLSIDTIFSIQSEITRAIANALKATLTPVEERQLGEIPTLDLAAYDAYLLGRSELSKRSITSLQSAISQFEIAVSLDPDFAGAWAGLCESWLGLYARNRDIAHFQEAENNCNKALTTDHDSADVHVALGALYRNHGDYMRAENELREAILLDEKNAEAYIELGLTLGLLGEHTMAESALKRALEIQPSYWAAHDALAAFYRDHDKRPDRYRLAAIHAKKVVELEPDSALAWNNLGTAYYNLKQFDAAKAAWDKGLEIEPTRTAYTNRGLQYYYEGRFADAAEMQRKAIKLAPSDHRAWGRLGESLRHQGGHEDEQAAAYSRAIEFAKKRLQVNEADWQTIATMSTYYAAIGEMSSAEAQITRALELSGRDLDALLCLALVKFAAGDKASALSAAKEAIALDDRILFYIENDPDMHSLLSGSGG